jgi:plastocyanin
MCSALRKRTMSSRSMSAETVGIPQHGEEQATVLEDISSQGENVARQPETLRLTRRVVAGGAIAVMCGGAALWASGAFSGTARPPAAAAQMEASPAAPSPQVNIANFAFTPEVLTVPVETEVVWMNRDTIQHTVTSDDQTSFASSLLGSSDTFSHHFGEPGTFPYHCSVHPFMTAKVVVQP